MDVERRSKNCPEIILADGLWGCGKSLAAPIISSLTGVGPFKIDQNLEVLTALFGLGKLTEDAYRFAVMNRLEENYFNNVIGREINLRPADDSSFFRTKGVGRILQSLLVRDVDTALDRRQRSGGALFQLTHLVALNYPLLFSSLPETIKIINVQRNPVFLVEKWEGYFQSFDRAREFTPSGLVNGVKVPFFALEWVDEWLAASNLERAVLALSRVSTRERIVIDRVRSTPELRDRLKVVYFADLLSSPSRIVTELEGFFSRRQTQRTRSLVKGISNRNIKEIKRKTGFRPEISDTNIGEYVSGIENRVGKELGREFQVSVEDFIERRNVWAKAN